MPSFPGVVLLAAVLGAGQESPPAAGAYAPVFTLVEAGERDRAVEALRGWPTASLVPALAALKAEDPACRTNACRTAALLHTEAAFVSMAEARPSFGAHLEAAAGLAPRRRADAAAAEDDFERRRRLAVGYAYQQLGRPGDALAAYEQVRKEHPRDAEALVALGSLHEHVVQSAPEATAARTGFGLSDAARCYERALEVEPAHVEARLRLGRVCLLRGRLRQARRELEGVAVENQTGRVGALARLFLGELAERERRLEDALALYRAAAALEPHLQPAHLSLGHVLQLTGRGDEARRLLLQALAGADDGRVVSWNAYHTTALHGFRDAMDRLWRKLNP